VTSLALAAAVIAGIALAAAVGAGVAAFVLRQAAAKHAAAATDLNNGAASGVAAPSPTDVANAADEATGGARAVGSDAASEADHASFGYIVSHDLRAPIRVVEGFTKIVKEDYGAVLDAVGHDHLDRVLGAAARMNSMIDALLQLSRLSSQPIARVPVNLSQIAGFVVDDLRREHPERDVDVEIEPQLLASGDPTLLRMLLENLLGNAWKYTGNTETARIGLVRRPGETTGFTVHDNGAGFDMRYADRLFGVFQRLHSASEFPGTGVGLASVRRIVRRHHGEVWAESEPERGTRFHFTLPLPQRADSATL
jgi:light-regulated signal transduction histidine kinase (bacteriophytochrome)